MLNSFTHRSRHWGKSRFHDISPQDTLMQSCFATCYLPLKPLWQLFHCYGFLYSPAEHKMGSEKLPFLHEIVCFLEVFNATHLLGCQSSLKKNLIFVSWGILFLLSTACIVSFLYVLFLSFKANPSRECATSKNTPGYVYILFGEFQ